MTDQSPLVGTSQLGKIVLPRVETCRYRRDVQNSDDRSENAVCELLVQISGIQDREWGRVNRDACEACCRAFPPTREKWNAVIASLMDDLAGRVLARGEVSGCSASAAGQLQQLARFALPVAHDPATMVVPARSCQACHYLGESTSRRVGEASSLEFVCHHPSHGTTSEGQCRRCWDWTNVAPLSRYLTLTEIVPLPARCSGLSVRRWSVGVLTAPRREPTLEWCLDSIVRAGWNDPHLFIDGTIRIPEAYGHLTVTWREQPVGAWPNNYLALTELVFRDPDADAYLLLQDDAVLYDRTNLREYLEAALWPGNRPGIVSLFCSQAYNFMRPGWHATSSEWVWGAQAFIFPREVARRFLNDPFVFRHRWEGRNGLAQIDVLLGDWAKSQDVSIWFSNPSLVQHVGNTSAIWRNSRIVGPRRAAWFAGDLEQPFNRGETLADFPESGFPCLPQYAEEYRRRVAEGRERMRQQRVVICGLCRDVRLFLPRLAARVERLGRSFRDYRVVLFENDSRDTTLEFLCDWQRHNDRVHVLSERLAQPRFAADRSPLRTAFLAKCRNRYREFTLDRFGDFDALLVVDTDLGGGWSFDGIADTFGHDGWDFVGAYGLLRCRSDRGAAFVHYDTWAYREIDHPEPHPNKEINDLVLERGTPLRPVLSCFGGLGIYRMDAVDSAEYSGPDCEHVELHQQLRQGGFDRLFLNPSQIVLYSP